MVGTPGFMKQMCDAYAQVGGNVIGALEVAPEETDKYGIISPGERHGRLVEVTALVEKPARGTAPSNLMIPGGHILQPEPMRVLARQDKGEGGEIQLTTALDQLSRRPPFPPCPFDRPRHACGQQAGYIPDKTPVAPPRPPTPH